MSRRIKVLWLVVVLSMGVSLTGCGVAYRGLETAATSLAQSSLWYVGRRGPLSEKELSWARTAWTYFENNYHPQTGLVNGADRYPVVSMWHVGDYLAALHSARQLGIIEERIYDQRLSAVLARLSGLPLAFGELPNTLYNAQSGVMVNYANQPEEIGWAIIDIGRVLIWLSIVKADVPHFAEYIDRIVLRWSFCKALDDEGRLQSAVKINDRLQTIPETTIGYTDYAQTGFRLWGLSTVPRLMSDPDNRVDIFGISFPLDSDWARQSGTYGALVSAPFLYAGLETHWDFPVALGAADAQSAFFRDLANRVYDVQESRFELEGISTARTDHQLSRPPFYVQDSIFGAGYPWSTLSDNGENRPDLALVSTRAVFGMWALWNTSYTDHLMRLIEPLFDPQRGWFEGRYENSAGYEPMITLSTNTMVLQALAFKQNGRLFQPVRKKSLIGHVLSDAFRVTGQCLANRREDDDDA